VFRQEGNDKRKGKGKQRSQINGRRDMWEKEGRNKERKRTY
jgi:hypothetical protein